MNEFDYDMKRNRIFNILFRVFPKVINIHKQQLSLVYTNNDFP